MDPSPLVELLRTLAMQPKNTPTEPLIQWHRAGANADEDLGFNAVQRATGFNLSPRNRGPLYQPELPPQNRISETFRLLPGFY